MNKYNKLSVLQNEDNNNNRNIKKQQVLDKKGFNKRVVDINKSNKVTKQRIKNKIKKLQGKVKEMVARIYQKIENTFLLEELKLITH